MIGPVTSWFEQWQLYGPPNAYVCRQILDSVLLSRYPRQKEIGFNNDSEFKMEFRDLLFLKLCRTWNENTDIDFTKWSIQLSLHHSTNNKWYMVT